MKKIEGFNMPSDSSELMDNEIEKIVQAYFETMILESPKVNEGNNGVIKRFDVRNLPTDMIDLLNKINPSFFRDKEEFAIKLLKIYTNGKGKKEYESQKKAYELTKDKNSDEYAMVPEIIFYGEMNIENDSVKEKLKSENINTVGDKIEIMIMDYVEGNDLAEMLYKEVLKIAKNNPNFRDKVLVKEEEIENLGIDDLIFEVSSLLGFSKPGGKHNDETMRQFEGDAVMRDNFSKMYAFLKKGNYVMDKNILLKLENTIKLFHENGMYHRDFHERNVMIGPSGTYIIDFGSAIETKDVHGDIYEEAGNKRVDDFMIIKTYRGLSETREESEKKGANDFLDSLAAIRRKIEKKDNYRIVVDMLVSNPLKAESSLNTFLKNFSSNSNDEIYLKVKAVMLIEASKKARGAIVESIEKEIDNKRNTPFSQNFYRKILKAI